MKEEIYYASLASMSARFRSLRPKLRGAFHSEDEFKDWKLKSRNKLKQLTGITKLKACDLCVKELQTEQEEGFTRIKYVIQTEKDVYMPFYVLKPDKKTEQKLPCIIAAHGHESGGKAVIAGKWELAWDYPAEAYSLCGLLLWTNASRQQ